MTARPQSDDGDIWLVNLPPTPLQSRMVLGVTVVLLVGLGVTALFGDMRLPPIDAFIPAIAGAVILTGLITAVFLFSQSWIYNSRALLVLASGYLFTALITIPHALTFPGAFSPTGLLGAGLQSTGWLYIFWHIGLPAAILIYSYLKDQKLTEPVTHTSPLLAVSWSVAISIGLVCGLTWLAIAGEQFLPHLFLDRTHLTPFAVYAATFEALFCVVVLLVLWRKQRSVLDLWLMVVAVAFFSDLIINGQFSGGRFSLGFYVSRIFSIVTSTIVLLVLLAETTRLYGRLARSNAMLRREQNNRLMNLEALAASISHEVRQPLTGITTSGGALLRYLGDMPPKVERARSAAERVIAAGHRINQTLDSVRNLFGAVEREQGPININDLALGALRALDRELKDRNVATRVDLATELPPVIGHGGQLQEVIVNLIQNAIEAMDMVDHDRREVKVRTERNGGNAISIEIKDTGPGIDPKKSADIFEAFYTTKPHGTGLGLAICRMIVERHGGQLSATSADQGGASFRVTLPQSYLAANQSTSLTGLMSALGHKRT